ncbi:MAG: AAC(3) family N-acetyltransferase [Clostridia bacterium]|nr:AAC(3) family N-acetyltransferase [Clostridia bacterium]
MATKSDLIRDLRALGIKENDTVLVHSSLSALGFIEGGAETVIEALKEIITEGGNLLFPTLSYATVNLDNLNFDVRNTPCCVGIIPETFRKQPDVIRSIHPTHSVCVWGKDKVALTSGHENDHTPVGPNSPFRKLPGYNGKILMLGCSTRSNTFMHGMEDLADVPYHLREKPFAYKITNYEGITYEHLSRAHNFAPQGLIQRYDRVPDILKPDEFVCGTVLEGTAYLYDAAKLQAAAAKKMKEDPFFFVDKGE